MKSNMDTIIKKHAYFNQKFFARFAKLYDYEKYFLFPLRDKAAKFFNLTQNSKIIDVATGTGAQAHALAKLGYDITGVDLSQEMLEQAKKKLNPELKLSFIHADATHLPFLNNTFDAASISLGLHDMPYEIRLLVLKEIISVIKNDGKILIVDYLEPQSHPTARFAFPLERLYETPMFEEFVHRGLSSHLKYVGLEPEQKTTFLGVFQIVVCTVKKH
jgi:demethylmenaquinone methyltransferase/2-methoxy-6-polyprenyl-1,4-benzoquinol methylase